MKADMNQPRLAGLGKSSVLAGCVCALLAGGPAAALELGEPLVRSTLGQRLDVVVPYRTWGNERLTAECVSLVRDSGGIPSLTAARVVATANGRLTILSDQGIREPLLTLNVKVDCPATPFLVRSYTVVLDPPGYAGGESGHGSRRDEPPLASTAPPPARAAARSAPVATPVGASGSYRVRTGDTLSGIAARVEGRTVGIWEMAERIFAANPEAFAGGDMDRLKAGSLLVIPGPVREIATPVRARTDAPATAQRADVTPAADAKAAGLTDESVLAPNRATAPAEAPSMRPAAQTAAPAAAEARTEPAGAAATATPESPFKDAAPAADLTESGPLPQSVVAESAPAPAGVSPLFAALFGAGIGLLLGLILFRGAIRDLFRRPPPAVVPGVAPDWGQTSTHPLGGDTAFARQAARKEAGDTDVLAAPQYVAPDDSMIVSEEEWDEVSHSQLRSLDMDVDGTGDRVITERELAVARMSFPAGDDSEFVAERPSPDEDEDAAEESMIVEVDTGAELAAEAADVEPEESPDTVEATGLATAVDLEMLEEDYQQEFTATQRLAKQLADAALALDHDLTDDTDPDVTDTHDADATEIDEGALLETAEMLAATLTPEDVDDMPDTADSHTAEMPPITGAETIEEETLGASRTTRLPSADAPFDDGGDEEPTPETAVVPMGKKRRA